MHKGTAILTALLLAGACGDDAPDETDRLPCIEEGCTVLQTFTGESAGDFFGWVTADVGDIDGDGAHDLMIGAPFSTAGGDAAGRAYLYSGRTGAGLLTLTGSAGDILGETVGAGGDVDGDGVPDLLAGGPGLGDDQAAGRAAVFSGQTGDIVHSFAGASSLDHVGAALAGLGDVDGDGKGDFLVGAPGADATGTLTLHSGADASAIYTLAGEEPGDRFGNAAGVIGDLDGDGVSDFAVSAVEAGPGGRGRVYVHSGVDGAPLLPPLEPDATSRELGFLFVGGAGDVDGDGAPDIYATDFNDSGGGNGSGAAYVYSGATGERLLTLRGAVGEALGLGHAQVGDVDGDGSDDLLIGAGTSSSGAARAGRAYVFSGRDGAVLRTMTSSIPGEGLGFDANGMGDVDGDGHVDFLISAAQNDGNRGRVYLIAGEP
jgi:hypothetical protein